MTPEEIDAVAQRVAYYVTESLAEQLRPPPGRRIVDAGELSTELGVSLDWVYEHADELGAMRLGSGPKARLRFELEEARTALAERKRPPAPVRGRPRKARASGPVSIER